MTQILFSDTITPTMNEHRKGKAIVIGGLATAIRLQAAGQAVTLVEARKHLGGRAYQLFEPNCGAIWGPRSLSSQRFCSLLTSGPIIAQMISKDSTLWEREHIQVRAFLECYSLRISPVAW